MRAAVFSAAALLAAAAFAESPLVGPGGRIVKLASKGYVDERLAETNALLSVTNGTLTVQAVTSGVPVTLWSSAAERAAASSAAQAMDSALARTLRAEMANAGDKAWGKNLPDGSPNPDFPNVTMLNAPATLFAGGCQWAADGTYAVLTCTGAVASVSSGAGGEFRICANSTNWFGFREGGSYVVGAYTDGINTDDAGRAGGTVKLFYEHQQGDGYPTIWHASDLALGDWAVVEAPVWQDDTPSNGVAQATVAAEGDRGFWKATTTSRLDSVFVSTMPAVMQGGVMGSTNDPPVVYDSVIEVTSGGHTYRIPAQFVR